MVQIKEKVKCSGCAACYNKCNYNAIEMRYDEQGFAYPVINIGMCVDCHSCEISCPYLHFENLPEQTAKYYPPVYACYNKNENIRRLSTSGGVFSTIAEKILGENGIVFAVRFDERFRIYHDKTEKNNEIEYFRGSKYAQSTIGTVYRQIKQELENNRKVLFVGLPCQVAGLKQYLNRKNGNLLYTCDFICMGIASPVIWENYLQEFEDVTKLKSIVFKDKKEGWHNWKMRLAYSEKEILAKGKDNLFFNGYLNHLYYRPACFECPFKGILRISDFTIGDCWGIDKIDPEFDDNLGISVVILQSSKARLLFEKVKDKLIYRMIDPEDVIYYNKHSVQCIQLNKETEAFYLDIKKHGFRHAMVKYCSNRNKLYTGVIKKIKRMIKWEFK
jgi:coenzyme F420-reducing hydrogenase beta subunit